jgi:predicted short-subunit dehydrogenase-like oxidoreductase (DUF2520 family)
MRGNGLEERSGSSLHWVSPDPITLSDRHPKRGWSAKGGLVVTVRLIGPGRAGRSLAAALADAGCAVHPILGRGDDLVDAAAGVDVLVLATPDAVVGPVARSVEPVPGTTVVHLSGALGLDVLAPHPRRGSLHPLVPLPTPEVGRARLHGGATFAVAGDPVVGELVRALGGRALAVAEDRRVAYHAAACIAANHVVALLGQAERVAALAGLPLDVFVGLTRAALDDVVALGAARALTGPAARGDEATLERHRALLAAEDPEDLAGYDAGVALARRLAGATSDAASEPASDAHVDMTSEEMASCA